GNTACTASCARNCITTIPSGVSFIATGSSSQSPVLSCRFLTHKQKLRSTECSLSYRKPTILQEEAMAQSTRYDIIIIGSGAGGGTLAYKRAPSGKRVLLLERGDYVPREKDNWNPRAVNAEGKYQTKEVWRDRDGQELHPHTNYYVGGNTKFFGAALFRLRQEDFGETRHHGGVSPAWPISYDEL